MIRLIENFNAFAVRAIEELERLQRRDRISLRTILTRRGTGGVGSCQAARSKRGWFGSKKKIPMTPELAGKPEDDVEVVRGVRARSARTSL